MTDTELSARLGEWQVDVPSVTERVMSAVAAATAATAVAEVPTGTLLADLLSEVRALRQEMHGLRFEVAALSETVRASAAKTAPHSTIKGYPLLPFAPPETEMPFFQ